MTTITHRDGSADYDVGEIVHAGNGYTIHRAVEKSLGTICHYHKIPYEDGVAEEKQRQSATAQLRRFGTLLHPRTPRLMDAWFTDDHLAAVECRLGSKPIDMQTNNPLQAGSRYEHGDVMQGSLELVAALHGCGVVHGYIEPRCFATGVGKKIHLIDTGLDRSLVLFLSARGIEDSLTLSTNLFGRDVGGWACAILSLLAGEPVAQGSMDEKWDDFLFNQTESTIRNCLKEEPLRDFFRRCLRGLGPGGGGFEAGIEALAWWNDHKLRGAMAT